MSGQATGGAGAGTGGAAGAMAGAGSGGAGAGTGGAAGAMAGGGTAAPGSGAGAAPGTQTGGNANASPGGSSQSQPSSGAAAPDWTASFNEESKGYVQNKGWKAPTDMVDSYRGLEKLLGVPKDQLIQLPKDTSDANAMGDFFNKLGRPIEPAGYQIEVPKEGGSPEFAKWASENFHKTGLSKDQGQNLVKAWNEYGQAQTVAQKQAYDQKISQGRDALKKEWGAAHDENLQIASQAVKKFNVDAKAITALERAIGYDGAIKFFNAIGKGLPDATFVTGNGAGRNENGPMTPGQAKAQIKSLRGDPDFVKRYSAGGHKERATMERLHQFAYQEGN